MAIQTKAYALYKQYIPFIILLSTFVALPALAEKTNYAELKRGDVINVNLDQLLPTQAVISLDEEYYNLGRYAEDLKTMYNDLCRVNGAKGIKKWDKDSNPTNISTYSCQAKQGENIDALPSVIIGPEDGELFLIDHHNILSTFWDMPNGGTSVPITLKVEYNLLGSGDDFWPELLNDHEVWLYNNKGKKIKPSALPQYIGSKQLKHDKYFSLAYFLNGIAYDMPDENKVPYVKLNWSRVLREKMDIGDYNLNNLDEYATALTSAATIITDLKSDTVIGRSSKTAKEMGQKSSVDTKALENLLTNEKSTWHYAMAYRLAKKEKATPKNIEDENNNKEDDASNKKESKKKESKKKDKPNSINETDKVKAE
ncbi:chromosome partitioning protein ParB [Photobacterium profundum]|uniref:ParB-like nuclease n=1 Tax=Photobacterium profundum 3TCK TaxID=314280 RepID=Q1Z1W1_9GAMM|nr:ParB/Srx family N-terminal domain-containing protein [Photobacterium profundum]EAS42552.1 hypothetical protein P3TCK_19225 [Photobacterium profundum 3TCK]PSV63907.1 chromosome partitioning protein ParB [Photobacterium profundum]